MKTGFPAVSNLEPLDES